MRAVACVFVVGLTLAATSVFAHGPQIQVTNDDGKIVTRQIYGDGPYYTTLSQVTNVYVMPLLDFGGVLYSRPNTAVDPILEVPAFPAGPGFAYGYDLADGGPQLFQAGSTLTLGFVTGLKRWDGAAFVDAGATQLKAFRGSNANIASPPENFATTTDSGPFDSLALPLVLANYGADGPEVHASLRFAMLGNGADPLSATPDGVYLVGLQLSSSQPGVAASDPYSFVLYKNASFAAISGAVNSLGAAAAAVQWTPVPEPTAIGSLVVGLAALCGTRFRRGRRDTRV